MVGDDRPVAMARGRRPGGGSRTTRSGCRGASRPARRRPRRGSDSAARRGRGRAPGGPPGRRRAQSGSSDQSPHRSPSPLEAEHQAVQAAADAEERDAVAGPEELAVLGQRGGQRQRDGADVAQVGIRREVLLRVDPQQSRGSCRGAPRRPGGRCTLSTCSFTQPSLRRKAAQVRWPSSTPCLSTPTESVDMNWREAQRAGSPRSPSGRARGTRAPSASTPPSSRRRFSAANEPSVRSTATAPEPPVSVASEILKISIDFDLRASARS